MLPTIDRQLINHPHTRPALRFNGAEYQIKEVRAIVAHWTANKSKGADAQANRNYFNNGSPGPGGGLRAASAHYIVDDQRIIQCVPDHEVAFHVGAKSYMAKGREIMGDSGLSPNFFTIGFEMCVNEGGDWAKTRDNSAMLAAWLLSKHSLSIHALVRHFDITGKDCPKMMLEIEAWEAFKYDVFKYQMIHPSKNLCPFKVTVKELNVRTGPGTSFPTIYALAKDEVVLVSVEGFSKGEWVEIEPGKYVNSKFLIEVCNM